MKTTLRRRAAALAAAFAIALAGAPAHATAEIESRFEEIEGRFAAGDVAAAQSALERLSESADEAVAIRAYLRLGEMDGVLAKRSGEEHLKQLVARYKTVVERYPSSAEAQKALYRLGLIHQTEFKDPEVAADFYKRAISDFADSEYSANAYMKLAEIQENDLKDLNEALYTLGKCASDFHKFQVGVDARLRMIALLRDKIADEGKTIDAMRAFLDAYPDVERSPDVHRELADLLLKAGRFDEGVAALRDFAAKFPDNPRAIEGFYRIAKLHGERREYAKEAEAYAEFVKRFPKTPEAARAAFEIGEVHAKNLVEYKRKMVDVRDGDGKKIDERVMYKLVRGSYRTAIDKYLDAYRDYGTSAWGRKACLAAADVYLTALREKQGAEPILKSLADGQPNTEEGKAAAERLKSLQ